MGRFLEKFQTATWTLVEFMSGDTADDFDEKISRARPRQNPVVAELRTMREDLQGGLSRFIWVSIAVVLAIAVPDAIHRWPG